MQERELIGGRLLVRRMDGYGGYEVRLDVQHRPEIWVLMPSLGP